MLRSRLLKYCQLRQGNFIRRFAVSSSQVQSNTGTHSATAAPTNLNNIFNPLARSAVHPLDTNKVSDSSILNNEVDQKYSELTRWIKSSLIEKTTPDRLPSGNNGGYRLPQTTNLMINNNINGIPTVDSDTFDIIWRHKFEIGDVKTAGVVCKRIRNRRTFFNLPQLFILIDSLMYIGRFVEIHKIYKLYSGFLGYLLSTRGRDYEEEDDDIYGKLLEDLIVVEYTLKNYDICENLFSYYIKNPGIKSRILLIGLHSFIENGNLQLSKEFFVQVMMDRGIYPLEIEDFYSFLKYLTRVSDVKHVKFFFQVWLKYSSDSDALDTPDFRILSLIHGIYLTTGDTQELNNFLNNEKVKRTGYLDGIQFEITTFFSDFSRKSKQFLYSNGQTSSISEPIRSKIQKFRDTLLSQGERTIQQRHFLYESLLKLCVQTNNLDELQKVLEMIYHDSAVGMDPGFHEIISRYFVKNGQVSYLLDYYKELVGTKSEININSLLFSLYKCFTIAYPNLVEEYKNEIRLVLRSDYIYYLPWTSKFERIWSGENKLSHADEVTYREFKRFLSEDDIIRAKELLISRARGGIKPKPQMYHLMLRHCLKHKYTNLAMIISDIIGDMSRDDALYHVKAELALLQWSLGNNDVDTPEEKVSKVEELEKKFANELNFQNMIQLANIYINLGDYTNSKRLIQGSRTKMNELLFNQWLMYYMTYLKYATRTLDIDTFLSILVEWNSNNFANYIDRNAIRQIKSFKDYFITRFKRPHGRRNVGYATSNPEYIATMLGEINNNLTALCDMYGDRKSEGLNTLNEISVFLRGILDQEVKKREEEFKRKQAELIERYSNGE